MKAADKKRKAEKKREYEAGAFITIEASFLLPLVIWIVLFVICLGLYLHGLCIIQRAAQTALLRAGNEEKKEESAGVGDEALKKAVREKMTGPWEISTDVKAIEDGRERNIIVKIEGTMEFCRGLFQGLLYKEGADVDLRLTSPGFDGADFLRSLENTFGNNLFRADTPGTEEVR